MPGNRCRDSQTCVSTTTTRAVAPTSCISGGTVFNRKKVIAEPKSRRNAGSKASSAFRGAGFMTVQQGIAVRVCADKRNGEVTPTDFCGHTAMSYSLPVIRHGIRIWYESLHVSRTRNSGGSDDLPLSSLSRGDHVHGGLRIEIDGRLVPHLGYWNADDACFGSWLLELRGVADAFSETTAQYAYDEGEQGQPSFVFERAGNSGFFSIADSQLSDGQADPEWQRVEFEVDEFLSQDSLLQHSFVAALREAAPASAEDWIRAHEGVSRGF